jgi:hypothetical protein
MLAGAVFIKSCVAVEVRIAIRALVFVSTKFHVEPPVCVRLQAHQQSTQQKISLTEISS